MDYSAVIKALQVYLAQIEQAIAELESLKSAGGLQLLPKRRGRKSMGEAERQEVSERMKRYWAARRRRR